MNDFEWLLRKPKVDLYHGDCLEIMATLDRKVNLVLTDPPYGTTSCKWDTVIPFNKMWAAVHGIRQEKSAVVLFGSEPFSSALRMSNIKNFKYDWIWEKNKGSNFGSIKYGPMKEHELISVFGPGRVNYYEQRIPRSEAGKKTVRKNVKSSGHRKSDNSVTGNFDRGHDNSKLDSNTRCPRSILTFNTQVGFHPTQKPVALLEYLIKTYTLPGETVLDFTMGSGSTGVAAVNTDRDFIGIEQNEKYFQIAQTRIDEALDAK